MRLSKLIQLTLISIVSFTAGAQNNSSVSGSSDRINYDYNGDETRLGIGIDNDGEIIGEFLKSFGTRYDRNWIGEAWYSDGAAGLKLNYHWINSVDSEQALIDNEESIRIWKVFGAIDQNTFDDRKVSLGFGSEAQDKFWNVNFSGATSGRRFVNQSSVTVDDVITGILDGRNFIQNRSTESITRLYENPYDWGIGGRYGHFFDTQLIRLTGGLDYEQGDFSSNQYTGSVSLEKYFNNTGHSLALTVEQLFKDGDFETEDSDTRASLLYRYDFGQTYRPTTVEREVEVPDQQAIARMQAENSKRSVVQNEIDLSSVAFFDLDSAQLREETKGLLDELASTINGSQLASNITIIGHTCWLGSEEYNLDLSERRSQSAKQYLVSQGIDPSLLQTDGKGESQPAYDNRGPNIDKNRRVVVSFLTVEDNFVEEPPTEMPTPMKWVRTEVQAPAAWINRALRNPAQHKRRVDVYKEVETEEIETLGDIVFLNTPPVAQDDALSVLRNSGGVVIDVLSNDSDVDPDDSFNISDVSQAANGVVINNGDSLTYTPVDGFTGTDSFTYTITDTEGESATATVTITVENNPPSAVDDSVIARTNIPLIVDVTANDSDPDGSVLTVVAVSNPANGTAFINADGTITYQASAGFLGSDSFTYTIVDADGAEATATVTVSVQEDNDAPVAVDDARSTTMNNPISFNVLENDSDPDGDVITVVSVDTSGLLGTIEFQANGDITYTPPVDWCGLDSFTYTITDGFSESTATVTINIVD